MSQWFVGQRVKLVRPRYEHNFGMTGTIRELFPVAYGTGWHLDSGDRFNYPVNCDIDWDTGVNFRYDSRTHTNRLEPIVKDDGRTVVSWEECMWQPIKEVEQETV